MASWFPGIIITGYIYYKLLRKFHVVIIHSGDKLDFECNKSPHIIINLFFLSKFLKLLYNSLNTY